MASTESGAEESSRRRKKRNLSACEKTLKSPKKPRIKAEADPNFDRSYPWNNLDLILSLHNKEIDLHKKIDLALSFINTRPTEEGNEINKCDEMVNVARVIVFINNWIQSVLISSEKKFRVEGKRSELENSGSCLDLRCWLIFKFCLEGSTKSHVTLSLSRDLLRVIRCVSEEMLIVLNDMCSIDLFTSVRDCVRLIFSLDSRVMNDNLDLWVSTIDVVLQLVHKTYSEKLNGGRVGNFVLEFSCLIIEPFSKFLWVHPSRKSGFSDFVDKLLEPLLNFLGVSHLQINDDSSGWTRKVLKLVEDALSFGIFHPVHFDGFLGIHSTDKYHASEDGKAKIPKTVIKSYHRHLFDKLEKVMVGKKIMALSGLGDMFRLFVYRAKNQKETLVLSESNSGLDVETRKSIFDFFVQVLEPLLLEVDSYLKAELEVGLVLLDVHCTLQAANKILASFMNEKVYVRTEDTSEGACLNFLKVTYDTIMSVSTKINHLWMSSADGVKGGPYKNILVLIAKEIVIAVGYFLEIEYDVIGNDLVSLWLMMIFYLAAGFSLGDAPDQPLLAAEVLDLACHLVNLYSELRQVNSAIFALCKAMRLLVPLDNHIEVNKTGFTLCTSSLDSEAYATSVGMLLCSQEFGLTIHNAIESLPEGQAGGCIRQISQDVSESLEWIEGGSFSIATSALNLQAEILGKGLCEIYMLVLDALTVTTGNCNLVRVSMKDLMTVVRPSMNHLVELPSDGIDKFIFSVTGRSLKDESSKLLPFTHWVFYFFFRLHMSSVSLYKEAITTLPQKKTSAEMGDSSIAYSGKDWLERTDWTDNGYFSWVEQAPVSLLTVMDTVLSSFPREGSGDISPLIYVLHTIVIQRLVELNKQINSFDYVTQRNDYLLQSELTDDANLLKYKKRGRKWKRGISSLRQEAIGLTDFLMGYLPIVVPEGSGEWDFGICNVTKKSLPTAIWWNLCRNTGVWWAHAAKKKLKMFLSHLICSSLPLGGGDIRQQNRIETCHARRVAMQQISLEILNDFVSNEQRFVCRYLASRFFRVLENSVSALFGDTTSEDVDLSSSPNWPEVLSKLGDKYVLHDPSSKSTPASLSVIECRKGENSIPLTNMVRSLIDLLSWNRNWYLISRSFACYATYILNLERLVVCGLLDCHGVLYSENHFELLKLLLSCRRALKNLVSASSPLIFDSSFPILWLLKSVTWIVGLRHSFSVTFARQGEDLIFSLLDHTSYVLLRLCKDQYSTAIHSLIKESESVEYSDSSEDSDVWTNVVLVSMTLKDQMKSLQAELKDEFGVSELNNFSSLVSCFQGFLWGLASAVEQIDTKNSNVNARLVKWKNGPISKLNLCINEFTDFISFFLNKLFIEDDKQPKSSPHEVDSYYLQRLKKPLLQSFLKGENPEAAYLLRQLFTASSAILKLNLQIKCIALLSPSLVSIFIAMSELLLSELADMVDVPSPFCYVWLDGILKFLEELGSHFPLNNPTLSRNVYAKLIALHLRVIGKCMSLQGKRATLASHETDSSTKMGPGHMGSFPESDLSRVPYCLDEFKARLRMSFKVLIKKPSELHLLSAIQALERALVGVQDGCMMIYEINTGVADGGRVSSMVAAGIDCLDLMLEFVSGRRRLKVVRRHFESLIAALFNIIVHLQGPRIFSKKLIENNGDTDPDPGSVVLMCVETLTRISGKHALFQLYSCHIAQALHIPAALFQDMCKLRVSDGPASCQPSHFSDSQSNVNVSSLKSGYIDRWFTVDLFDTCCRLLCTVLKHHQSESERCIVVLEESVCVLLHCLETSENDSLVKKGYFAWDVQEGVKCARSLRRIYEEMRQQKDIYGQHCFKFLSRYVWVYSRCGPLEAGITREVDEALRPGVYALLDACSPDDLQHLHTVFGEGPCRSTLAALQYDYKQNFKYTGKV